MARNFTVEEPTNMFYTFVNWLRRYALRLRDQVETSRNDYMVQYVPPESIGKNLYIWFKNTNRLTFSQKFIVSFMVVSVSLIVGYALFAGAVHGIRWIFDIDNVR